MQTSAIRKHKHTFGWNKLKSLANSFGNHVGSFDGVVLHIDDAHSYLELIWKFLEHVEVFTASPRELKRELMDFGFEYRREEISVVSCPRGLAIAVSITYVQGDLRIHTIDQSVNDFD